MNKQQEYNIELIRLARHNDLVGEKIADDLMKNKGLWRNAYGYFAGIDWFFQLIPLRDMENRWHIDTIALTCKEEHKTALLKLIKKWKPTEVSVNLDDEKEFKRRHFFARSEENLSLIIVWWD